MRKIVIPFLCALIIFVGCQSKDSSKNKAEAKSSPTGDAWTDRYDKIEATEIPDNAIQLIGNDWMLVTAGTKDSFNMMTASWGGLGEMWNAHVSMITIRSSRYTHEFIEKNDSYTLSFFTEEYRGALKISGSKSGRDTDKVKESGLTPVATPSGLMTFAEARMIIECKKLYAGPFDKNAFVDEKIITEHYTKDPTMHTLFISEITNVWVKK